MSPSSPPTRCIALPTHIFGTLPSDTAAGTLSETFARLSDSVFWESPDTGTLYVNVFVSATASWRSGAVVRQASAFPYGAANTTALTVVAAGSAPTFTLALRVPGWATTTAVTLNGGPVAQRIVPGSFLLLSRAWADGDTIVAHGPPALRFEQVNDPRPQWQGVGAFMFGAIMLAAVNVSSDSFPVDTSPSRGRSRSRRRAARPARG